MHIRSPRPGGRAPHPCAPEQRYEVGNGLRARGAHSIIHFGRASAETLSGP
jgi:hypothetical protein